MTARFVARLVLPLLLCAAAIAAEAPLAADDPQIEARMQRIVTELRCLVCQNQTVADSHSGLADDLRREVRTMLRQGASDDDIRRYMTERYGDFVLYRPPLKTTTALLWAAPALLLVAGLAGLTVVLRRRSRLPDDRFDAEAVDDRDDPVSP